MSLLSRVSETLTAAGVRHAIIGAMALATHGVNRATVDTDLLVVDSSSLLPELWSGLSNQGVDVDIRRGDLIDPLAGVVRISAEGEDPLDVVVGKFVWQRTILERAESRGDVPVVRAADLILLKLYAGGPQDAWDIQQLLQIPSRDEVVREVEQGLADLPPRYAKLWKKILTG